MKQLIVLLLFVSSLYSTQAQHTTIVNITDKSLQKYGSFPVKAIKKLRLKADV